MPGPGLAIQLRRGTHAGRIIVPCNARWFDAGRGETDNQPYALYSDDHGKTWTRGQFAPRRPSTNEPVSETQVIELEDASVRLVARTTGRATAVSRDGGATWSAMTKLAELPEAPVASGLIRYSGGEIGGRSRLLYSMATDAGRNGVVWLSKDEGATWPVSRKLRLGSFEYSSLVRLEDGTIGCMFGARAEESATSIVLARFTLDWLTEK